MAELTSPELALRDAVKGLLAADAAFTAIVGPAKLFDQVPADKDRPAPPWSYLGPVSSTFVEYGEGHSARVRIRLYFVSTDFGRDQAWAMCHAARLALHRKEPALGGGFTREDPLTVIQAGDIVDPVSPKACFLDVEGTVLVSPDTFLAND